MEREFEVGNNMIKDVCPVCKKNFKIGERIILLPIQKPTGDFFINSIAIPIHTKCYYVEKDEENKDDN
jgi:hypothetical protein